MTDIMSKVDQYILDILTDVSRQFGGRRISATTDATARAALQSAIEALQGEVGRLKSKAAATDEAISWATPHVESIITERDQLRATLTKFEKQVTPAQVEAAWRAGWAACRDAEYVGQEAEDEAWGMSETCASADWENAAPKALEPLTWYEGEPPFPQNQEWFIAQTVYGDRVVLRALPKESSYDYRTADGTYMMAKSVKQWMQFPDCEFLPPKGSAMNVSYGITKGTP